jgi:hypothetical protein
VVGQGPHHLQQIAVGDRGLRENTELVGARGVHLLTCQHYPERRPGADGCGEPLRAAVAGDETKAHLRQPEPRALGGDDQRAGQRELEPATQSISVDRRDHGRTKRLQRAEDPLAPFEQGPPVNRI